MSIKRERGHELRKLFKKLLWALLLYMFVLHPIYNFLLSHFQNEAVSLLHSIVGAEYIHYQIDHTWAENFGDLNLGVSGPAKYCYFVSPTEYEGLDPESLGLRLPIDFQRLGSPDPGITDVGFVVVAIGNIDFDKKLDIWWIDNNKILHNPQNDIFSIWRELKKIIP